jgi:hypothetical protein
MLLVYRINLGAETEEDGEAKKEGGVPASHHLLAGMESM